MAEAVGATAEPWDAEAGSFTYDANGNLTTAPGPYSLTAVTYDYQNLPLSLTRSDTTTTYRYTEAGQRITKQVGLGNTEYYVRDGALTLGVPIVGGGQIVGGHFNLLAGEQVVGRASSAGKQFYHPDLLGSTRAVTDGATGAVVESYDYDPWGVLLPGRTLAGNTKEGFTGKERDPETGLDYFGARYQMAALGRWASTDPASEQFPEWTPYNYVLDNPPLMKDPDGKCPIPPSNCVDVAFFAVSAGQFIANPSWSTAGAAALDALGLIPGIPSVGGARHIGAGIMKFLRGTERIAEHADEIGDATRAVTRIGDDAAQTATHAPDVDFVVTPGGTTVPVSQSRMKQGFERAGFPSGPTQSPGTEYVLPNGQKVRAMEPSGSAPRRASFENAQGHPVTPDGTMPQPPPGLPREERARYVRERTHVNQKP